MKTFFLLALGILTTVFPVSAANTIVQVPTQQLKTAYTHRFGHAPDLNSYGDLELAINTCLPNPQAWVGGFWDGFKTYDPAGAEFYEVVLCDAHRSKLLRPALVPIAGLFKDRFGRQPDFEGIKDRALTISTFITRKEPTYAGAFWNGERGNNPEGVETVGLVCVEPEGHFTNVPAKELKMTFSRAENREPNLETYGELSRSIVYWAKAHGMKAPGGFWNGEMMESNQGPIYGVVFVDGAP